ncbi:MAG: hypothetical protein R3B06_22745 [Kofleriaceae bacterium]
MRAVLASLVCLLATAGCFTAAEATGAGDDLAPAGACLEDTDCVLAGPTCCDCPTYATSVASGWADSCANVGCQPPTNGTCAPLAARCEAGACVVACAPTTCDLACPAGFATDASGCLQCACAPTTAPAACALDTDCVQVPDDCCGCARGGRDTAVPTDQAGAHVAALGCPADPGQVPCPEVTTCDPTAGPRCVEGQCQLAPPSSAPPPLPDDACGRDDLQPCPPGQVCTINQDPEAGPQGVGVCTPAPMP